MDQKSRMQELIRQLNEASKAYYAEDQEIMSNFAYDALYDELVSLEAETGIILSGSPTQNVGYESVDFLPKETHEKPMLSLAKTKEREELASFLGSQKGLLSWKLDGLTIVLTYDDGKLTKGVTRGNGTVGEVITPNVKAFLNVPLSIQHKGHLVLRGEAVITYSDFEEICKEPGNENYKNPRNLCSGSVRQLDSEITKKRRVKFFAFTLVEQGDKQFKYRSEELAYLKELGFDTVEYKEVDATNVVDTVSYFAKTIETYDVPSDGLVLTLDDIAYGESLGMTAKAPRSAIAFKWADETMETQLLDIEWSPSRTGLINPVAIFEPVELEGTTVSRASVHNISIVKELELGIGDRITVYKANMIIPQIEENLTRSGKITIPCACPACGGATEIVKENASEVLMCINPECPAKKIKSFTQFVSRNGMNMDGISESTLEKFIANGFIHEFADLYHLDSHKVSICEMEGFGEKSYENLIKSVNESRQVSIPAFLFALGIPGFGVASGKLLAKNFDYNLDAMMAASEEELSAIDNIGPIMAKDFYDYMADSKNRSIIENLRKEITFEAPVETGEQTLKGYSFVITGSLNHFSNRDELKEIIENKGGKVTGSVTSKTTVLINNDVTSSSSKNKKAKELGIPILSEDDFLAQYGINAIMD